MLAATYRFNKTIATVTIRFIVTEAYSFFLFLSLNMVLIRLKIAIVKA